MKFSPSTGGFYHQAADVPPPADAVDLTMAEFEDLLNQQAQGKMIVAGDDGRPIAADPPPPPKEEIMERLRRERDRLLAASDFSQMPDIQFTDSQREAWATYRQQLRDIPALWADDPASVVWPIAPNQTAPSGQEN